MSIDVGDIDEGGEIDGEGSEEKEEVGRFVIGPGTFISPSVGALVVVGDGKLFVSTGGVEVDDVG